MQKLSYEFVKNKFEEIGYKLLSNKYENAHVKLLIECPKEHQYEVTYGHFQQNRRCPICEGNQKYSYKFIKEQIEKEGYKLLSKEYENGLTKLKVECNKGHEYRVKYNGFQQGGRCPVCAGTQKLTFSYIKTQIEKNNYKLLSKEYENVITQLKVECPKGHQYEVTYNHFQRGQRCPICW